MTNIRDPARLRIIAANLTTGSDQSYNQGDPGTRILKALASSAGPDSAVVVLLQEANVGRPGTSDEEFGALVRDTFGPEYGFIRTVPRYNGDSSDFNDIPNAVIAPLAWIMSNYPVEMRDKLAENRDHGFAMLDIPGLGKMAALSLHLLTRNSAARHESGAELVAAVKASLQAMAGAFVAIGGDFNTNTHNEAVFDALGEVVDVDAPYPVDEAGLTGTNADRRKPYDGVFVDQRLEAKEIPVTLGGQSFPHGLVVDTRKLSPALLAALRGVQKEDSGADKMQHMAVVRDFALA